ncbi:MAG TPA: autotransporter-associated beta strand repeat-containing protein, partial [Planctomycetota bacterium]|nr:autotransporter-associated beta strand repeat-containing protein [Planctomycetota bacterium]
MGRHRATGQSLRRLVRVLVGVLVVATATAAVPTSGLVAHWKLDETSGASVADSAGSNTGTRSGGAWTTAGHVAGGFDAQAAGQISLGTSATLAPAALTASYWMKRTGTFSSTKKFVPLWAKASTWNSNGWFLEIHDLDTDTDDAIALLVDGGLGCTVQIDPDTFYPANQWVHVAVTFNAGTCAIYRNGVAQTLAYFGTPATITASTSTKYLGYYPDVASTGLPAAMDEVRIYDRALSAAEVGELARERTAIWTGGGGNANWTTTANWQNSVVPVAGDTVVFDGAVNLSPVNDYAAGTAFRAIDFRAGGFNVTGSSVTLTTGVHASAGSSTLACPITLAGDQVWTSASSATSLTIATTVATAGATLTLDGSGSGAVSNVISGTGALRKTGTGVWTLSGTNTYTGDTTILCGGLRPTVAVAASTDGAFGNSANPVYLDGGLISVDTATFSRAISALSGGGGLTAYGSARTVSADIALSSSADTPRGLVASFFLNTGLALRGSTQEDWRLTQTVVGTRIDANVLQASTAFGTAAERAAYGISGSDADWDTFAVQWDGWIRIPNDGVDLFARSDDGSRVWLDRDGDSVVDAAELSALGWGLAQGNPATLMHENVAAGTYRIRIQVEDGTGPGNIGLFWSAAAKGDAYDQMCAVPAGAFRGFAVGSDFASGADGQQLTLTGTISGAGALTKTGTSTALLGGTGAGTGATYVDGAGTLQLAAADQLPSAAVLVESGATLACAGFADTVGAVAGHGAITLGGSSLTLGADNGTATFAGVISGAGTITKSGSGTQTFSGANTYSGATTVSVGTLSAANAAALGTTAAGTTVTSGACLSIAGVAVGAETVSLAGTGVASGGALGGTGTASLSGAITMTADSSVASSGTLTLTGAVGGAFALTKVGSGVVALSAANGYSGATTVSAGTLRLTGDTGTIVSSSGVTIGSGATLDISNSGTLNPDRIGAVTVTMNGGNLTMTAPTNTNRTESVGSLAFASGHNIITMVPAGSGSCQFTAATMTRTSPATLRFVRTPPSTGTGNLFLSNQVDNTVLAWTTVTNTYTQTGRYTTASGLIENLSSITVSKTGGGNWSTNGTWTNGEPTTSKHAVILTGHTVTMNLASQTCGSLEVQGGTINGSNPVAVSLGTVTATASSTISAPVTTSAADLQFTILSGATLTVSGVVSGTATLTKTGPGTLALSAANTYTGATTVVAGALVASNATSLGTTAGGVTVADGGQLELSAVTIGAEALSLSGAGGGTGALLATGTCSCSGTVALAGGTTIGGTGTLTLSGVVSGAQALTKLGSGHLILTGNNTYSGATTISVGRIRAGHANALGATSAGTTIASGAVLDITGVTLAAEPVALTGTGAGFGGLTGSGTAALPGAVTLTSSCGIGGSGAFTISGVISGSGSLTKQDAGTLILTALNTYTGTTTIAGGIARAGQDVVASSDGAFGNAASAIQLTGGVLESATATFSRAIETGAAGGRLDGYGATRTIASTVSVAATSAPNQGLTGSYVAAALRLVTEDDWRATRTVAATRVDATVLTGSNAWGTAAERAAFGIGGSDTDWDTFSVQWDGYIQVVTTCAIATQSDDNSRVWLDLDADDVVDAGEWGSNNWGGAAGQSPTTVTTHASVAPGVYRIRVQYDEGAGANSMYLLWSDAANSAGVVDSRYVIPAARLSPTGFAMQVGGVTAASAAGQQLTLSGAISGAGGIEKIGTSTVVVTGAGTYTGTTTVTAGTLALGAADRLPATALTMASGATFDLAGFNETVGSLSGAGTVTLGIATLTTGDASSTTFAGAIGGSGGLTKQGAGTFTLSGANGFTGATTINAGTLLLAGGAALADAGAVVLADVAGATLQLSAADETIGSLAGGGASGGNVVLGARLLTIGGSTTTTYDGVISGTGAVTRSGTGVQTLTRACTFTGATTVSAGTLNVNAASASATGSLTGTGTIGGTGTVGPITSTAASSATVIRPGTAASRGTFAAGATNLSAGTNPTVQVRVAGYTTAGTSYDRLDLATAAGALTLGGSSILSIDLSGVTTIGTATGVITCAGTPSGTFTTVSVINNPSGFAVTVQYNAGSVNVVVAAGTRYWDGGGADNNWSTAANWAGDTVPDTGVVATFHATHSNKNCTVDAAANTYVAGIAVIGAYTGTISQGVPMHAIGAEGFVMSSASATYTCTDVLYTRSFSQTAGTYSTSGTLCLIAAGGANTLRATSTLNHLEIEGLDTGLVGYWKLDEAAGGIGYDWSGNGHHGTYTNFGGSGAPSTSTGTLATTVFRNAASRLYSQANRQLLTIPDADALDLTGTYTTALWMRIPTIPANTEHLFSKLSGSLDGYATFLSTTPNGHFYQNHRYGTAQLQTTSTGTTTVNTWLHGAAAWDGATVKTWRTGQAQQSSAMTAAVTASTGALGIGGNPGGDNSVDGYLDDARLYSRALSEAEIHNLRAGLGGDATQSGTVTLAANLNVAGDVKIHAGTLALAGLTLDVKGSWTCYGALDTTGTVAFTGTGAGKTIRCGEARFNDVQIASSDGTG